MNKIYEWLKQSAYKEFIIEKSLADASFRKYYRLRKDDKTALLMDSSLEKESLNAFLRVHKKLTDADVGVSKIYIEDLELGYLILEDFGSTHYLDILNDGNFQTLYTKAINTILKMQKADVSNLPLYDKAFLHKEMDLMQEWYLEKLLNKTLTKQEQNLIFTTLDNISKVVLEQPQGVFVHRDFHSRNIMLRDDKELGIIDYQDAMNGAVTYDLVSLLKDCYIAYDRDAIKKLVLEFRDKKAIRVDDATMIKWFDFMGLQRHIKVLGIFSRLYLRDSKDGYLKDIPLTLKYVVDTAARYDETKEFGEFLSRLQMIEVSFRSKNFSLEKYFQRINYSKPVSKDLNTLKNIVSCQLQSIAFENTEVIAKQIPSLKLEDIFEKIVNKKRGGYCYEVNGLLAMALTSIGFDWYFVAARPMLYPEKRPKTHMVVVVVLDGKKYLCDTGFGGYCLREPIEIKAFVEAEQNKEMFRLELIGKEYVLSSNVKSQWISQYGFADLPQEWIEFSLANYYNATHPNTIFTQNKIAIMQTPNGRKILMNDNLKIIENGETTEQEIRFEDGIKEFF